MRKVSNIKAKVQSKQTTQEDLENFLFATDRYIDSLEEGIEMYEGMVENLDEENDSLIEYTEELEDEAGEMFKYIESLEFQLEQANAELIANKVSAAKDFTDTMIAGQEREGYLNSFLDKKVVMSEEEINDFNTYCDANPISEQQVINEAADYAIQKCKRSGKKGEFNAFRELIKIYPTISNEEAASALRVSCNHIIAYKCMLVG